MWNRFPWTYVHDILFQVLWEKQRKGKKHLFVGFLRQEEKKGGMVIVPTLIQTGSLHAIWSLEGKFVLKYCPGQVTSWACVSQIQREIGIVFNAHFMQGFGIFSEMRTCKKASTEAVPVVGCCYLAKKNILTHYCRHLQSTFWLLPHQYDNTTWGPFLPSPPH